MRKQKRTYKRGRPIDGWAYGRQVRRTTDVKVGDILIGDSHMFRATNLYRVVKIRKWLSDAGQPGVTFDIIYVGTNRRRSGPEKMSVAQWELNLSKSPWDTYYFAHKRKEVV